MALTSYFTPYDQANLNEGDIDVGSGRGASTYRISLVRAFHELVEAGKEGTIYVVDRDNMGHYNPNDNSQIVQNLAGELRYCSILERYRLFWKCRPLGIRPLSNGLLWTTPMGRPTSAFRAPVLSYLQTAPVTESY